MKRIFFICLLLLTLSSVDTFAADRIELDATSIQGSRELPKILYIVPWKSARLSLLQGGAGTSSLDTSFEALDRDVFRRQVEYYGMLYGAGSQSAVGVNNN
jgi:hypothetical protein